MHAIRLTKKNLHKILNESPIERRDLETMIEEYDTPYAPQALFFVPVSDIAHDLAADSWMTIPWKALQERYTYDQNKIDTEFVEIKPKGMS